MRGVAPGLGEVDYSSIFKGRDEEERGGGFQLKVA
jgi:cell division cycle 2-like protein